MQKQGLKEEQYNAVFCDPEYEISSDAAEIGTGKQAPNLKRTGFIHSWIRDWGSMIGTKGSNMVILDSRKGNLPDPLKGVANLKKMETVNPGLKFDGGAFTELRTPDNRSFFFGTENEFVNNNTYTFRQEIGNDVDPSQEAFKRLKMILGGNTEIILLPSLRGNSVDHIDMYLMTLGDNDVALGQALEEDPNYAILESVKEKLARKNLDLPRVPVRRHGDNIISWTNVLPHITEQNEKFLFMPTYEGFETENTTAAGVYKELGFQVVPIDATSNMHDGGAVHCATNTSITAPFLL